MVRDLRRDVWAIKWYRREPRKARLGYAAIGPQAPDASRAVFDAVELEKQSVKAPIGAAGARSLVLL